MRDVVVAGIGMHRCGKFPALSLKDLGGHAVWEAIRDAGVDPRAIECAYVGNAAAGLLTGQEMVRGQVVLRWAGLGGIPIINVETACASSTLALREAWIAVGSGMYDIALALGMEKMFIGDTAKSIGIVATATDVEWITALGFQFMGMYAGNLKLQMERNGWTQELFAKVAVKGKRNGSLNPFAQYQTPQTVEEILSSRVVAWPLTLYMCSTMGDGAAAAIICSREKAQALGIQRPVHIRAQVTRASGFSDPRVHGQVHQEEETPTGPSGRNEIAYEAYEAAGIGPEDLDLAEIHDATAPAELGTYSGLGLCNPGDEAAFFLSGATQLEGTIPINTSGGLAARGHPIGATGLYQIAELVLQLRGDAAKRQIPGRRGTGPKVALASNGGGVVEGGAAASCATILTV